jgi:hypothetical protein
MHQLIAPIDRASDTFLDQFLLINFGLEVRVALCDAALGELSQRLINL